MLPLFAVILPLLMFLMAMTFDIGNWFVHARHLQTKVDASAFAGGGAWSFPCATDSDTNAANTGIIDVARRYVGEHTTAAGTPSPQNASAFNPQVGGAETRNLHAVFNGPDYFDEDSNPTPSEGTSPAAASICESKTLDVKGTESNNTPLFGWIPFYPDIKRKARVEIQEAQGISGLLPIGVRIPKPEAAAAAFYDESTGAIEDVKYFCEDTDGFSGLPAGLGGWTTLDTSASPNPLCSSWADVDVGRQTGVAIATSVRQACEPSTPGQPAPCLEDSNWVGQQVNSFCRQASGVVQCWDATGFGSNQNVQSGVQFIRGYDNTTPTGTGPPQLRTAYLDAAAPFGCHAYFSSVPFSCRARITVKLDLGALAGPYPNPSPPPPNTIQPLRASDVEVRYMLGRSDGTEFCDYGTGCDLLPVDPNATGSAVTFETTGAGSAPHPLITQDTQSNAIAIRVRVRNAQNSPNPACQIPSTATFDNNCAFWWTANGMVPENSANDAPEIVAAPIQRSFSGSVDRTGPLRWLRLTADLNCGDGVPDLGLSETVEAASVPGGRHCFYMEMGLQGAVARDQDEPPIAFNLGTTGSQRALLDCDPGAGTNLKEEIQTGCSPLYQEHPFTYTPHCPADNSPAQLLGPHPPPWDSSNGWPPPHCVVTQTGTGNQIMDGFNERLFGTPNPSKCPDDDAAFVPGRNYWHNANNDFLDPASGTFDTYTFADDRNTPQTTDDLKNRLQVINDPRYVTLFFTTFDSFASAGNETFPIVGFGGFYVTGYGRTTAGGGSWQGGVPEDPCTDGNSGNPFDGMPFGVGNEPPPDLNLGKNQTWVWGHFITPVFPAASGTPSGKLCDPAQGKPCVVVLVE
ncbi:MAG: Tad domain-containing protein [Gemmatimonadota bacterium]